MELLSCFRHQNHKLSMIHLGKTKASLLCDYCLFDNTLKNESIQLNSLFHILQVIKEPESVIQKLSLDPKLMSFLENSFSANKFIVDQQLDDLNKQLKTIQEDMIKMFDNYQKCIQKISEIRQGLFENAKEIVNFDQLKQILVEFNNQNGSISPDAIEQIQQKIFSFFKNLNKQDLEQKLNDQIEKAEKQVESQLQQVENIKNIKQNIEQIYLNQIKLAEQIFPKYSIKILNDSTLINKSFEETLLNSIKQRTNKFLIKVEKIFLGSKDGLNNVIFWQKVNQKNNLLMIFKSKSGKVFGSYSPLKWEQCGGRYCKDDSNISFLFSQTHNEIYPLIKDNNNEAICCNQGYGPVFGRGDCQINSDFQNGQSVLGTTYKFDNAKNNRNVHLFGQTTPNIEECEIYELTFKQ